MVILLINLSKSSKSSCYSYPEDPKLPNDILSTITIPDLTLKHHNVIDFWLVGLASVITKETSDENDIG